MKSTHLATIASGLLLATSTARAAETITYSYDAQGRVKQVLSTGSVNGTSSTCYFYDKANNRVHEVVVRSATCPAS